MDKSYDPKKVEDRIYRFWEEGGFFNPDNLPKENKDPYTIIIPPPNITGTLHMGHALNATVQDVLIRRKRMQGYKTLWLPGTDHAGIATQNVVEKKLKKEGKTRFDLGREKFLEEVWKWKEEKGNEILNQFKKIGCSCDWSRTRFTMDESYVRAVNEAFHYYYNKGWIYQGERVVNWCPRCFTSLSDLELEYEEEEGKLYYIKYGPLTVATTRPETMLGDTAVAVNPKDERYKDLVGKKVVLPLVNKEIPVVADRLVDFEFGTGAVKVTPAHDFTDSRIAENNNLESIKVIDEKGRMTDQVPEKYQGLKVKEAREKVLLDLKEGGFLEKEEDHLHQVPKCYRCSTTVELIPSLQWFVKMEELAKKARKPVEEGRIKIHPENFKKTYLDWLDNIKDWCISRQLWWGHKIPIEGEEDVLDTWFSSALWPFATLGWPEETKDLKTFYSTDVLSTARDIINLWVVRMIFSGMEFMEEIPFKDVYIHATILTKDGQRMSKSLGTGIDPLKLIDQYGADATRFGIIYQVMGNQDLKFADDNIVMGKKFCNKIWNATRFVTSKIDSEIELKEPIAKTKEDKEMLEKLKEAIKSIDDDLDNFRFGQAAHTLYEFFWHDFCDICIEASKKREDEEAQNFLMYILATSLKLMHPFIPFLTEEIYQNLPIKNKKQSLMIENWPQ